MQDTQVQSLGWEDPLEEGMATHSSILAWRIPMDRGAWWAAVYGVAQRWTRLKRLSSSSSSSSSYLRASLVALTVKNPPAVRETWVLSLGWEDSPGEGKGYPLQYSGLENPMDCIVHGVIKSRTRLSNFHRRRRGVWRRARQRIYKEEVVTDSGLDR